MRLVPIASVLSLSAALVFGACTAAPAGGGSLDATDAGGAGVVAEGSAPDGATSDDASEPVAAPDATVVGAGNDHCSGATEIPLTSARADLRADTTAATHDVSASCAADSGPDVFYQFTVSKRVIVYADTFGAGWNTVLFLLSSACKPLATATMSGDARCSDDACGGAESQVVALLEPGSYRLGLGGSGGASGAATIHFEYVLAASGIETELPAGVSEQTGATMGQSGNVAEQSPSCVAAGPEDGFWWTTCPGDPGGKLVASTCGGATWPTLLATEIPRARTYACAQDSCDRQTALTGQVPAGAGLHLLLLDGQEGSAAGTYTMQVTRP
jgi:hypothetical protein